MTAVEKIKAKILDLAIRGKLVPQDPNDEPASILLGRIKAEKAKLVKAKKIKKEKNPSEIIVGADGATYEKFAGGTTKDVSDELPFDLPQGWAWARIKNLGTFVGGHTPSIADTTNWENGTVLWVTSKDMKQKYIDTTGIKLSRKGAAELHLLPTGSLIMVTRSGILRRTFPIALAAKPLTINQDQRALEFYDNAIGEYIYYCVKSLEPIILRDYRKTGTTVESIVWERFVEMPLPIPPIEEQKRIVSMVEELFGYAKKINEATDGIEKTTARIDKKILDLAIHGKLVPQDPRDEPASELVRRITAARTIKAGGKKSRVTASDRPAYEIEPPFDIPDSWEWVNLGAISNYGECQTIDAISIPPKTWSLDLEEIEKGTGRLLVRKFAGEKASTSSKHKFSKGMILYSKLRTYLNKVLIADMDGVCTSEIIPITLFGDILPEYIRTVLMSPYFLAYTASKDYGVKMPRVGTADARAALIPLPPLSEQKRIVSKIAELRMLTRKLVTL